jgi:hypothetical protein
MSETFGGLVDYYNDFVPRCLPRTDGAPRTRRSAQQLAKAFNFPLIRVGYTVLIDPVIAAERLREAQLSERAPRRRGRPRKYGSSGAAEPAAPLTAAPTPK